MFESTEHDSDARFADKLAKRTNKTVKRPKASRRRSSSRSGPASESTSAGSPGGIRQRRNKRWNW